MGARCSVPRRRRRRHAPHHRRWPHAAHGRHARVHTHEWRRRAERGIVGRHASHHRRRHVHVVLVGIRLLLVGLLRRLLVLLRRFCAHDASNHRQERRQDPEKGHDRADEQRRPGVVGALLQGPEAHLGDADPHHDADEVHREGDDGHDLRLEEGLLLVLLLLDPLLLAHADWHDSAADRGDELEDHGGDADKGERAVLPAAGGRGVLARLPSEAPAERAARGGRGGRHGDDHADGVGRVHVPDVGADLPLELEP
mmetsp:Transcript_101275/g.227190  ORF Transcript_101275/g.227190 Transcript_101275/m.227190 type:complete len:255 (-) Transcript_101275:285-1049(-)